MKRTIYKKLLEWKNAAARSPLILKGTRQVGKSYILQAFGENDFSDYHTFNFEKDKKLSLPPRD
ncbi:MAG: AAA family ATPase [Desulfobacteraceae bacterium]|uniref:AAA family ATPase n=1 Tax=Candidatus Desulfacyla euxinica TaxID=2841693 RepID=A0A8J6MWA3_9DELT|nr:AAA family ATPase [Candidatus Desulfacyla euxinica]MBL6978345.1 AAA family ATPase [Desulfobacteraceae bacterium]